MLGLGDLTQTKFYQEAFSEGRQEGRQEGELQAKLVTIKRLSKLNLSVELIAQGVEMSVAEVQEVISSGEGYNDRASNPTPENQ